MNCTRLQAIRISTAHLRLLPFVPHLLTMCVLKRRKGNREEQTEGSEADADGGALRAGHSDQVSDRTTLQQSEAAKNEKYVNGREQ